MEWLYGISGTLAISWIGWISWEAVQNHSTPETLKRIDAKLDRLIERFL